MEGDEIEIPPNVLVRCPLKQFDQRRAKGCEGCEHFGGLTEMVQAPNVRFHHRFAIQCRHPIDRELAALAED